MNYIFVLILYICQPLSILYLFSRLYVPEESTWKIKCWKVTCLILILSANICILYIWCLDQVSFRDTAIFLLIIFILYLLSIWGYIILKSSTRHLLYKLTLITIYMEMTTTFFGFLSCFPLPNYMTVLLCLSGYLLTVFIIYKFYTEPDFPINTLYFLGNTLVALLIWYSDWVYAKYFVSRPRDRVLLCLLLMLISILNYFNFVNSLNHSKKIKFANEKVHRMQLNKLEVENVKEQLSQIRALRHEFKNHIYMMGNYLRNRDLIHLEEYFNEMEELYVDSTNTYTSGNSTVDAILNYEKRKAEAKAIPFAFSASLPEELKINILDLSALLFNLIDNAIEASEHVSEPFVEGNLLKEKMYVSLILRNRSEAMRLQNNPSMKTTKSNPSSHGIGLRIVKSVVEKYDGAIHFSQDGELFQVSLIVKDLEVPPNSQRRKL
ncbi:sensor histidine kinase [Lactonifactor longoviformis]|uniref:sensor histidine kinase n=1 Tax=Lactonifactor longoviformis TaxID=341220 RepID=UPI001D018672|nr:GHKL domain-containing protein [Lactonifactor longoviformis]MCB5711664.1 GHKL domain-containing protein [Lactonifactor longoviformis]MCB5715631.1 GHKL domain-containing protein [Lactonifactor longoviformis]